MNRINCSYLPASILALIMLGVFLFHCPVSAQYQVKFKSGGKTFPENAESYVTSEKLLEDEVFQGQYFRYFQFFSMPGEAQKKEIRATGIRFLEYIPNLTFLVAIPEEFEKAQSRTWGLRSVVRPGIPQKVDPLLLAGDFPDHAMRGERIELILRYQSGLSRKHVGNALGALQIEVLETSRHQPYFRISVRPEVISGLAEKPFVNYLEPVPPPSIPDDTQGRSLHRANVLDARYDGGRRYDGSGVRVLVRDDGPIGPHIDFTGRTDQIGSLTGTHGDGVAGLLAGAGNLEPAFRGMAPGAFVYVRDYEETFLDGTLGLHLEEEVMITNSSYSNGCNAGYTSTAQTADQQSFQYPSLLHVFSAGNSNGSDCGYGAGFEWGNITGGHKQGKNVIAVANLYADEALSPTSSRGPAHDGRIKPDIAAHGQEQISTSINNTYQIFGGTSAAAPCIAGVSAQLYQAYRALNGGADPPSALIKAILLNTAEDLGNPGPDFKYGWGRVNALKAVQMLEEGRYLNATIAQDSTNLHLLTIPHDVRQARIMIYWPDVEASLAASPALVNNLDLQVTDPASVTHLPWIPNPTPDPLLLDQPAAPGVDTLNNMEQVVLMDPPSGDYTVHIDGTAIPFGPREYFLVYTYVTDEITLTYPQGGEGLVPGEDAFVRWDAYDTTGTFTLEYSIDNGASWTLISNAIPGSDRQYLWTVPDTPGGLARMRISRGTGSDTSDAPFAIFEKPAFLFVSELCYNAVNLFWDGVPAADSYDVFMLGSQYMDSIGTTTDTFYQVQGLMQGNTYWFSVRPRASTGVPGRRAVAVEHIKNSGTPCAFPEIAVVGMPSPDPILPMSCNNAGYGDQELIRMEVFNFGDTTMENVAVSYQLNGGSIVTEQISSIAPGETLTHSFMATADMSQAFDHQIRAWLSHPLSTDQQNDTIVRHFRVLQNPPLTLPVTEGFEEAEAGQYTSSQSGLAGIDRLDFETTLPGIGRLRTASSADFYYEGQRALTFDVNADGIYATNYAILTFNLEDYIGSPDLSMRFALINHGDEIDSLDKVWVRGSPDDPWIEVLHWSLLLESAVMHLITADLSSLLANAGQSVGCLTQLKFGQYDNYIASTIGSTDGLTIDQVRIFENSLEMARILEPGPVSTCSGSSFENISVRLRNHRSTAYSTIPLGYRINGGPIARDTIPGIIPAGDSLDFTFSTTVDFTMPGDYSLEVWIDAFDTDPSNDTLKSIFKTPETVTVYPYVQTFDGPEFVPDPDSGVPVVELADGWTNSQFDSPQDWSPWSGPTMSTGTGPEGDHTSGSGKYLFTEDSAPFDNDSIVLVSPCFDLNGLCQPRASFWYHSFNASQPDFENFLHIDVLRDDGVVDFDVVSPIGHDTSNAWRYLEVDLSSYAGVVRIRFRSTTNGGSYTHDIAIDDFSLFAGSIGQTQVYVDSSSSGGDGLTWGSAFQDLQEAIQLASACAIDTILIARGTYYPDSSDRAVSFALNDSRVMLGGFPSGGAPLALRDPEAFPVRLSGDIGLAGDSSDNALHIVRITGTQPVEINGFEIVRGNANGTGEDATGAAVLSTGNVRFDNVVFREHSGSGPGAVILNDGPNAMMTFENCVFQVFPGFPAIANRNGARMEFRGSAVDILSN